MADFDYKALLRRYGANLGEAYELAVDCRLTCMELEKEMRAHNSAMRFEDGRFNGLLEALASVLASRMKLEPRTLPRFKHGLRQHILRDAINRRDRARALRAKASR